MGNLVDRQVAIQKMRDLYSEDLDAYGVEIPEMFDCDRAIEALQNLPSAEPEIIYCKDCRKHNQDAGYYPDGHVVHLEDSCPLIAYRGKAQGHEFDYQYCVYAERKEDDGSD